VTVDDLSRMVSNGELRFLYWDANGRGMNANSEISAWIQSSCTVVQGFDTSTQNAGAPDGLGSGANTAPFQGFGGPMRGMSVSLYDCGSGSQQ
jgi:hypothetical protein